MEMPAWVGLQEVGIGGLDGCKVHGTVTVPDALIVAEEDSVGCRPPSSRGMTDWTPSHMRTHTL